MTSILRSSIILLITILLFPVQGKAQSFEKNMQKVQMAWQLITTFYVDSVNQDRMGEEAVIGMLKTLDPHSTYISAQEAAAMNEPLIGSFDGVGIEFNILNDTILVVNPIVGGPSEKVGIKAGDRIMAINDTIVAGIGIKNSDVMKKLRGLKGTKVNISILRRNQSDLLQFTVTRDKIPIHSLDASYMATPTIGYIKLNRFAATSYDEFTVALKKLQQSNAESLILDLRGNGGGYLNAATDIADELLDNHKLIVYTEGASNPRRENLASKKGSFEKGKLVILIDEGSASASEIVSGAIQDWDRGIIVGRRSYGKGLVQRPFTLPDGSIIRLTVAKYYTPSGRCIQKPYEDSREAYNDELLARIKRGELLHRDSIQINEKDIHYTKESGRKVFGGGGILPDVFVPADTLQMSPYYRQLVSKGIINRFIVNYIDNNRTTLKNKYTSFDQFNKTFTIDNNIIDQMVTFGKKEGVPYSEKEMKQSEQLINTQMKALIARDLWSPSEYYQIINPIGTTYIEAIKLLEDKNAYSGLLK